MTKYTLTAINLTLARAIGEAHRRYTRLINFREGWRGYLWQGRFKSFILDGEYVLTAARYIELNPVVAGLVSRPEDWPWSSAAAHLAGEDDRRVQSARLLERCEYTWQDYLRRPITPAEAEVLRKHEATGRPLGRQEFVCDLEKRLGRRLQPQKAGRRPDPKKE